MVYEDLVVMQSKDKSISVCKVFTEKKTFPKASPARIQSKRVFIRIRQLKHITVK